MSIEYADNIKEQLINHEGRLVQVEHSQKNYDKCQDDILDKLDKHDVKINQTIVALAKLETQIKSSNRILFWIATMVTGYVFKYFFDMLVSKPLHNALYGVLRALGLLHT